MSGSNRIKGFAAGIAAAVCYGTNPLGALPLYADGVNSGSVLFYRYVLAVLMFAAVMILRGEDFRIKWGHAIRLALLGTFFAGSSITLFLSFLYIAAGIASTLLFVYPILTAVMMATFYHEHVTWGTALSILLALLGVALLTRGTAGGRIDMLGFSLVMMSSLCYAVYIVSVNRWQTSMSPLKFTFWIVFFGMFAVLVFSFLADEPIQLLRTPLQWACGIELALLPTVLSLFFMTVAIKELGSTPAAIMGALEPVTAVVIGVFVFNEAFSLRFAFGIVLILTAVVLVVRRNRG